VLYKCFDFWYGFGITKNVGLGDVYGFEDPQLLHTLGNKMFDIQTQ